jgi:uridine kinase
MIIAIDGRAASGKTTLARQLAERLGAGVVHMDDFFLPPELRTEERLGQPGGNIHYERFIKEVLPRLTSGETFSYRLFDCGIMGYNGTRRVNKSPLRVVEGAYSHHPRFGGYADLRIFVDVAPETQRERVLNRGGPEALTAFESKWIPLEEAYIQACSTPEKAHIRVTME